MPDKWQALQLDAGLIKLALGATNLARLSAEEQAIATAKNWTLA